MVSEFEHFIKKNTLFKRKHKLLLAFSGGIDSVCLFHLLLQSGYNFSVAHCNFGLRGKESDKDEQFVKSLADKHNITCHLTRFDTLNVSKKNKTGIQETARFLRYHWFETLISEYGYDKLLTAHHLGDNTETMLINLIRSTGISGLHGITLNSERVCRPMLFATRSEIASFIKKKKLKFREDSSNQNDYYLRNAIRHHVVPELLKIDAQTDQSFFKSSQEIAEFENMSRLLMKEKWESICTTKNQAFFISDAIFNLPVTIYPTLLFYQLKPYGFTRTQTDAIANAASAKTGFSQYSADWEIIRERKGFILQKKQVAEKILKKITKKTKKVVLNRLTIDFHSIDKKEVKLGQSDCLFLDAGKITYPLLIRNWASGDKIQALGMKGRKNVSDILTDRKIPHSERDHQLVLVDANGNLLSVLPNIVAETCKLDAQSTAVLRIHLNPAKFVNPITIDQ
jgi:tRNA(Ile)-lysidine synthase